MFWGGLKKQEAIARTCPAGVRIASKGILVVLSGSRNFRDFVQDSLRCFPDCFLSRHG
jgi:hypothetical protein